MIQGPRISALSNQSSHTLTAVTKEKPPLDNTEPLFALGPPVSGVRPKAPLNPVWTENKARLIERYLYYFVLVTKHGTYIDGFAGPQYPMKPESWAARLVLESEPPWLKHFHLFEIALPKLRPLRELRREHPDRDIHIYPEDFNRSVARILRPEVISAKEAAFCLIDQQTFECHWTTLEALARYKERESFKIEIFYFLANEWLPRAIAGIRTEEGRDSARAWWGREDWPRLADLHGPDRAGLVAARFTDELGYASALPWPIYKRRGSLRVMYYMIHATDHPDAPHLMARAYKNAVAPKEPLEQLALELGLPSPD